MGQDADKMRDQHAVAELRPGDTVRRSASGRLDYDHQPQSRDIRPGSDGRPEGDRDIAEIKADIRLTRAEMGRTIDELQQRLEPGRLKRQVGETVKASTVGRAQDMFQNTRSAGSGLLDRVRQNPVPAAMVAIGLGWLLSRSGERTAPEYGLDWETGYGQRGTGRLAEQAQDRLASVAGQAQAQAGQLRDNARAQASQAKGGFDQMLTDSPLAVGAVALAAGVAVGMAAPTTPKEHELMGSARDRVLDQAQSSAQEAVEKAQQVAQRAVSSAREEARNQGLTS